MNTVMSPDRERRRGKWAASAASLVVALVSMSCGGGVLDSKPGAGGSAAPVREAEPEHPLLVLDVDRSGPASREMGRGACDQTIPGWGAVRSPEEDAVAFFGDNRVVIQRDDGGQSSWKADRAHVLFNGPVWSPGGQRLAILDGGPLGIEVVVIDGSSGKELDRELVPKLIDHFPVPEAGINTLSWAPMGERILVSWERAFVVDLRSGDVVPLPTGDDQAVATWMPDGSILYLGMPVDPVGQFSIFSWYLNQVAPFEGLYRWDGEGGSPDLVADAAALKAAGIEPQDFGVGALEVSPVGTQLAVMSEGRIQTFPIQPTGGVDLSAPAHRWDLPNETIFDLAWAPDSSELALLTTEDLDPPEPGPVPVDVELLTPKDQGPTDIGSLQSPVASVDELGTLLVVDPLTWER